MDDFEQFESALVSALLHLHDPTYVPEPLLSEQLALPTADMVRSTLVNAIDSLRPGPGVPPGARAIRMHALLDYRFVRELPQKETARKLGISSRHLRREQQDAIRLLAKNLLTMQPSAGHFAPPTIHGRSHRSRTESAQGPASWSEQLREELSALAYQAPGLVANVSNTIQEVVSLSNSIGFHDRDGFPSVQIALLPIEPDLVAGVHPSLLEQLLIIAVEKMASLLTGGTIHIQANRYMRWTRIVMNGERAVSTHVPESDFIREALAAHGGTFTVHHEDERLCFTFLLPGQDSQTVLVADDNVDLVHFYRRFVHGTQYRIVHVAEGRQTLPTAVSLRPDVIILDVMLPDINGWSVLQELRAGAVTREIPVIVCSVVRQATLAHRLGATDYLVKPIHRHEFLAALARLQV